MQQRKRQSMFSSDEIQQLYNQEVRKCLPKRSRKQNLSRIEDLSE